MDRLEQAARQQAGELARVTTVGLDPVARPLRHQARRHHRTVDAASDQMPVETEARRARLVAAAHPRPATQHTLDRLLVMWQRPLLQQLVGAHRRQPDRARMDVQPNRHRRRRVVHGRRPPYVALPGPNPATHDKCVGADHSPTTTGHRARKGHGSILSKIRRMRRSWLAGPLLAALALGGCGGSSGHQAATQLTLPGYGGYPATTESVSGASPA